VSIVFLTGGARSGKSQLALELARQRGGEVVFIATGTASVEEPRELERALGDAPDDVTVVIDCLSLWVANLLETVAEGEIGVRAEAAARIAATRAGTTIVVTNEVGLGLVPMHPVGRAFRDALGRVNAVWSSVADDAYLVVAGRVLPLSRPGNA